MKRHFDNKEQTEARREASQMGEGECSRGGRAHGPCPVGFSLTLTSNSKGLSDKDEAVHYFVITQLSKTVLTADGGGRASDKRMKFKYHETRA